MDRDPAYHFDADPDPDFSLMRIRIHNTEPGTGGQTNADRKRWFLFFRFVKSAIELSLFFAKIAEKQVKKPLYHKVQDTVPLKKNLDV